MTAVDELMPEVAVVTREIEYCTDKVEWSWWNGELLTGTVERPIAFDTETELIAGPLHVPRLALAMAFDGKRLVLIHPNRVAEFVSVNRRQRFVGHNLKFDFWVLHQHLEGQCEQRLLWDLSDKNRLSDTMILDQLIQLATGKYHRTFGAKSGEDVKLIQANLAVVAEANGLPKIDKEDPYRLRFGELLDLTVEQMEALPEFNGFVSYALGDVLATYRVYERQYQKAIGLVQSVKKPDNAAKDGYLIMPGAVERFGPLTEYVQVQASIVLDEISRHPLPIDQIERQSLEDAIRVQYQSYYDTLLAESPDLFKRYRSKRMGGRMKMTARSLVPQMDQKILKQVLQRIADEKQFPAPQAEGKTGGISTSAKSWAKLAHQHPFIEAWIGLEKAAKKLEFVKTLDHPAVYSKYSLLMRTGRTSAGAHTEGRVRTIPSLNVQQMPRDGEFRKLFVAPPGFVYAAVDFSYIELRTLAATTAARYGFSKLKDAVVAHTHRGGLDPHEVLALSLFKLDEDGWRRTDKALRKTFRQRAKCCSFGYPGGLGAEKFIAYAEGLGVTFTKSEAKEAKEIWYENFPEMKLWLGDRTRFALRHQLGPKIEPLLKKMSDPSLRMVCNLLRGLEQSKYSAEVSWRIVEDLVTVSKRWDLLEAVQEQTVTRELSQIVTDYAVTLTGRIRANTTYTDGANTPFQGLAADGAKIALHKLRYRGYKIVIFVHDEIVVQLPEDTAEIEVKRIERLMNEAMEEVLDGVPCAVESEVSKSWSKP